MRVSPLNEIQVLNVSLSLEQVCKIDGANCQIQNFETAQNPHSKI